MTLHEWALFVAGIVWGIFIIRPLAITLTDTVTKIWKNAKEAQNG